MIGADPAARIEHFHGFENAVDATFGGAKRDRPFIAASMPLHGVGLTTPDARRA